MWSRLLCVRTCRGDVRTAAHFQQFEGVAVVGHQHFEGGVVHGRIIDLQGREGFGVDEDHRQSRDEVRLLKDGRLVDMKTRYSKAALVMKTPPEPWRSTEHPSSSRSLFPLTLGSSMKLGLAVEMSLSVFKEQFTSWERISHAASADSLLLST